MYWSILLFVYVVGIIVSYFCFFCKWENHPAWERIYFAVIWPLILPLYIIHYLHNKDNKEDGV